MIEWLESASGTLFQFLEQNAGWIIGISIALLIISLLVIRHVLIWMPADYFLRHHPMLDDSKHPFLAALSFIGRNLLGLVLLLLGLVMSLPGIPGQGILTVFIGLLMMNFPGKRKLELLIIRQQLILSAVNAIRAKGGKPPLEFPAEVNG